MILDKGAVPVTDQNIDMKKVWQQDKDHYVHPWTDFSTFKEEGSLVVAGSDNVHIVDGDGSVIRTATAVSGL